MEYIPGDFLLIDEHNTIVSVSGNTDFWDQEESMPTVNPDQTYLIAKVLIVQDVKQEGTTIRKELDEEVVYDY